MNKDEWISKIATEAIKGLTEFEEVSPKEMLTQFAQSAIWARSCSDAFGVCVNAQKEYMTSIGEKRHSPEDTAVLRDFAAQSSAAFALTVLVYFGLTVGLEEASVPNNYKTPMGVN